MRRRDLAAAAGIALALPGSVLASGPAPSEWSEAFDVVITGSGAAGLSAAAAASMAGARVLVLEKNPHIGGDTLISGGFFNAVDPERQRPAGIEDSVETFRDQIIRAGDGLNDPVLAETLAREALPTLKWLESLGMQFLPTVQEVFGSGFPRCHKPLLHRGTGYVKTLSAAAIGAGTVIRVDSPVRELLLDASGRVAGVRAVAREKSAAIRAMNGVVVACGGFGANKDMLRRFAPEFAGLPVDSQPGATGELILEAASAGAALANMSHVECVPGASSGFDYPMRLDYVPSEMIIINSQGERFVDETAGRREIARAIIGEAGNGPCFSVSGAAQVEHMDLVSRKNLHRGRHAGEAWRAETPEELARMIGVPAGALEDEVRKTASSRALDRGPFWAARIHLRVHHTLGGLAIDRFARVMRDDGRVIPGLFAAGEAVGNVHGAERIGGNGIASACVFGRIAGISAAKLV